MNKKIEQFIDFYLHNQIYMLIIMFLLYFSYILLDWFLFPEIAIHQAKNPNNIKTSCLYLVSTHHSKQGVKKVVEIAGRKYQTDGYTLNWSLAFQNKEKQFPFYHKNQFYNGESLFWNKIVINQDTCYEVKFIRIFDLFLIDVIYLYDFKIPKEFQHHHFQPIQIQKAN